jgi:hypothetical protein
MTNSYRILGLGLGFGGALFAPLAYFILNSVPLTAVAMSTVIIGVISFALSNTRPYISPEACELMLETGMENSAALLEELGLKGKAVYLPSAMRDGHPQALVPLIDNKEIKLAKQKIPGRLIVRYGSNPDDIAIAVTTPGSINVDMLETKPGPTASEIESAAGYILTGVLDIASSISINISDSSILADVKGARLHYEDLWYYRSLGSPIASIIASISSEALDKPVRIKEESYDDGRNHIELEILP